MAIAQLTSRIDKVKLYAAGATITRIADFTEASEHIEIPGLPLALDDSSVRVRVEAEEGTPAIAADIRIGLAIPPRSEVQKPPADEEVRAARAEVQRIEDLIALIDNEIKVLYQLHVPDRPDGEVGKAPPVSPMSARLALANFSDEQIRAKMQEKRENLQKLRKAKERLDDLLQKQAIASSAREVRQHELRKTVIVRLNYQGEARAVAGQQLVIEYFVPGARWTPSYVCRLDSAANRAAIAVRALICQRTGEDWAGVQLELSTALPMTWSELPELPSLRLGRAQSALLKSGWRRPPIGAEILFEDFDRQKKEAASGVRKEEAIGNLYLPHIPPLPDLKLEDEYLGSMALCDVEEETSIEFGEVEEIDDTTALDIPRGTMLTGAVAMPGSKSLPARSQQARRKRTVAESFYSLDMDSFAAMKKGENSPSNLLAYSLMRMGDSDDPAKRGKLSIEQQQEIYLEILQRQKVVVNFDVVQVVQKAASEAQNCIFVNLPPGGINVREIAGSFDYAYSADGRVDVPSDGAFHSVALTSNTTDADVRYVVVPREDINAFRIAQLHNPLRSPLLAGPADVYVDGEYILSTNIATVPPLGQMELGLGVEQAIKVARNTFYDEARSGETLVAFNELRHKIQIDITNHLHAEARIEVRERLPIPQEGAKVDVQIDRVSPAWEKYEQEERGAPIRGGYRWRAIVPARDKTTLLVQYKVKIFVDSELIDGNRREA